MRSLASLALALVFLVGCSSGSHNGIAEDFGVAFEKMQSQPEFLYSRAHPDLEIVQEFRDDSDSIMHVRSIPCGLREIQASGWNVLPSTQQLKLTGTAYGPAERIGPDQVSVALGPDESEADAQYVFRASGGEWKLIRLEIYSYLEPGSALPALPCNGPEA